MFYAFTQHGSAATVIVLLLLAEQSIETPCSKYMKTAVHLDAFSILLQVRCDRKVSSAVFYFFFLTDRGT